MNVLWIILLWLLGVSCANETKTESVMPGMSNSHSINLSTPKIARQYKPCPGKSSSSKCVLQCSAANAQDATLTIYNGSSTFSITKVADLSIELILCLEVEHQDNNTYSCVINNTITKQTTNINNNGLCVPCRVKAQISVGVTEGESVTLHTNVTELQTKDHLVWNFECFPGHQTPIAEININGVFTYGCELRFKDRLQLESRTGELTITSIAKTHSGVYTLRIDRFGSGCWKYIVTVTVYAPLPVPVVTRISSQLSSSSSSQDCCVLCSVFNVSHVTLSWLKGNSLLSSISTSDLRFSLSLPLEVKNQDKSNYSCVINNTISHKTTHLEISELCPDQSNNLYLTIGLAVGVGVLGLIICAFLGRCFCSQRQSRQEDARNRNEAPGFSSEPNPNEGEHQELISTISSTN